MNGAHGMKAVPCSSHARGEMENSADNKEFFQGAVTNPGELSEILSVDTDAIGRVTETYPMFINPYMASMVRAGVGPVIKQLVPDPAEIEHNPTLEPDPFFEESLSPVRGLVYRYPGRVLFLVTGRCASICRFCMRKRLAGRTGDLPAHDLSAALSWIASSHEVFEVILSGGDPLMLSDHKLGHVLSVLKSIRHVRLIRIHTRMPVFYPSRITSRLASMIAAVKPVYMNIHVNHPSELTGDAVNAISILADAGIPLGSQSVLLANINDDPEILAGLFCRLLELRVRPYYLHHPDPVSGTFHFRVPVEKGLEIMASIQGRIPGIGVPHYMIDLPGGEGKIPLAPERIECRRDNGIWVRSLSGRLVFYPSPALEA